VISKALLTASGILLVAFNVFVIVRHLASATLFLCLVNSLVIGVLIPSAFVLYLYHPKTRIKAAMAEGTQAIALKCPAKEYDERNRGITTAFLPEPSRNLM